MVRGHHCLIFGPCRQCFIPAELLIGSSKVSTRSTYIRSGSGRSSLIVSVDSYSLISASENWGIDESTWGGWGGDAWQTGDIILWWRGTQYERYVISISSSLLLICLSVMKDPGAWFIFEWFLTTDLTYSQMEESLTTYLGNDYWPDDWREAKITVFLSSNGDDELALADLLALRCKYIPDTASSTNDPSPSPAPRIQPHIRHSHKVCSFHSFRYN